MASGISEFPLFENTRPTSFEFSSPVPRLPARQLGAQAARKVAFWVEPVVPKWCELCEVCERHRRAMSSVFCRRSILQLEKAGKRVNPVPSITSGRAKPWDCRKADNVIHDISNIRDISKFWFVSTKYMPCISYVKGFVAFTSTQICWNWKLHSLRVCWVLLGLLTDLVVILIDGPLRSFVDGHFTLWIGVFLLWFVYFRRCGDDHAGGGTWRSESAKQESESNSYRLFCVFFWACALNFEWHNSISVNVTFFVNGNLGKWQLNLAKWCWAQPT